MATSAPRNSFYVFSGNERLSLTSLKLVKSFCLETIGTWLVRYRTRRHLSQLDNDLLRDIGLSVKAELREARPPFWK